MGDLDRALNPWMFDKSGNMTPAAQQQFPDLNGTPAAITTSSGASGVVQMDTAVLASCGNKAQALSSRVTVELGAPQLDVTDAVTALMGFSSSAALNTGWSVWQQQYQNLASTLGTIGQNLIDNANGTAETDQHIAAHMRLQ
ncbi:hypothetical protein ABH940_000856 [Streptacidiphilus sp. BW17]|jgi:hypothetical protein